MRRVELDSLSKEAIRLIEEKNPLSEDIGIFNKDGNLSAVIITPEAYAYFIRKIEEDEDRHDAESLKFLNSSEELKNARTIDDFLNEEN